MTVLRRKAQQQSLAAPSATPAGASFPAPSAPSAAPSLGGAPPPLFGGGGVLAYTRYSFACFCVCKNQSSLNYPRPLALPTLLQHYCATFAQYMTSPRPSLYICHTPYNIGNGNGNIV